MFAEITVTAAEPLSPSLEAQARVGIAPQVPAHVAIAQTGLADIVGELPPILAAKMMATHVVLVSRRNEGGLDAYVELANVPVDLRRLRAVAETTAGDLVRFLEAHGYGPASAQIGISAEGVLLQTGRRHSWLQRLLALARKEIAVRLSVPAATFFASLWFDSDVRRAALNAVAAFAGLLIWLLGSVTLEEKGYTYE